MEGVGKSSERVDLISYGYHAGPDGTSKDKLFVVRGIRRADIREDRFHKSLESLKSEYHFISILSNPRIIQAIDLFYDDRGRPFQVLASKNTT